ncbi:MAG TPA: redoxin domain-containing protein [Tepidisphaeraceae bacterium]|jgi:peroxiredoxin
MRRCYRLLAASLCCVLGLSLVASVSRAADPADTSGLEGKPAPDVTLPTLDGKNVKLADMKGKVVILDFWATWCPPCRKSLPHLQATSIDKAMADKGLVVWAINVRETNEQVTKFLADNKYTFTVPMDPGTVMKEYLVRGIPTTVIVGRDGSIKKVFIGFGDGSEKPMDDAIKAALDEK